MRVGDDVPRCDRCHQRKENLCRCPETLYERLMGHEPPALPADDPLAHQWTYRGTPAERAALAEELLPPVVIDGQDSLL